LVSIGETKLLEGVRVTATKGAAAYSTVSDAGGKYFLPLPGSGSYVVRAELSPYKTQPAGEISVNAKGCVIQYFAFQVENRISRKVLNEKGAYVEHAKVSLVDVENRSGKPLAHAWVVGEGNYRFEHVPPGRYILAINPEGPEPDVPLETTYYPLASKRTSAKVVEIKGYQSDLTGLNLVIGNKVMFRQVTVKVTFTDGTPMKSVAIRCTAHLDGNQRAGALWSHFGTGLGTGVVKFEAPTNVPLRIEVEDWYRRDLGATYTADFDAGSTPISYGFKIKP
jgi:hypothetical protein